MGPGRKWYAVALVVLIMGGGAAGLFATSQLAALEAKLMRFVVPGEVELALAEPGVYTIFHETRSVVDGRYYASESAAGLRVRVVSAASGAVLPLRAPGMDESYSFGGHSGVGVLAFDLPAPDRVQLAAGYEDGRSEPKLVLTVGQGFLGALFATVLGAIAIGFAAFGVAVAIASVTYIKRRRAREGMERANPTAA